MLTKEADKRGTWKDYVQPVGMLAASTLNLAGAGVHQITSTADRDNPFYFTAMTTSAMYMVANGYAAKKVYDSHRRAEEARRNKPTVALQEIVIQK